MGRHRERTVLRKTVGVAQVGQVFARSTHAQGVALGHCVWPLRIEREGVACLHPGQVGAHRTGVCGAVAGRMDFGIALGNRRFTAALHDQHDLVLGHGFAHGEKAFFHHTAIRRQHLVLHLHGLQHQQHLTGLHGKAWLYQQVDDVGLQGRAQFKHGDGAICSQGKTSTA